MAGEGSGRLVGGVALDRSQRVLSVCSFDDCRARAVDQPLHMIVFHGRVHAVCERCYRTRFRKGDRGPPGGRE
jgi:hypothetical protein